MKKQLKLKEINIWVTYKEISNKEHFNHIQMQHNSELFCFTDWKAKLLFFGSVVHL